MINESGLWQRVIEKPNNDSIKHFSIFQQFDKFSYSNCTLLSLQTNLMHILFMLAIVELKCNLVSISYFHRHIIDNGGNL
jgi:hypothetical protein